MITISIKIDPEDKGIIRKVLGIILEQKVELDIELLGFESLCQIKERIQNKKLTMNMAQTIAFKTFLRTVYSRLGAYEQANAIALVEEIDKKINSKIMEFNAGSHGQTI
jgi:ribosomal protein S20